MPSLNFSLSSKKIPTLLAIVVLPIPGMPIIVTRRDSFSVFMIAAISVALPTKSLMDDISNLKRGLDSYPMSSIYPGLKGPNGRQLCFLLLAI